MEEPKFPANEEFRLAALEAYEVLDTEPESELDALTKLAAYIADTPIALISLVDGKRQWFKSRYGLDATETPRSVSFCGHAILHDEPLLVPDSHIDPRFDDNPLVTGPPHVRFYFGVPLVDPDGYALGTLCTIDHTPRELSKKQKEMLALLAEQVVDQFQLRRQVLESVKHTESSIELHTRLRIATESCGVGIWEWDITTNKLIWDEQMYRLYGISASTFSGAYEAWEAGVHPDDVKASGDAIRKALSGSHEFDTDFRVLWPDGTIRHLRGRGTVSRDDEGNPVRMLGTNWDVTDHKLAQEALRANEERFRSIIDTATDAIITIDDSGIIQHANPAVYSLFGYFPNEIIGNNVNILMPTPHKEAHDRYLATYLRTNRAKVIGVGRETEGRKIDGSTFPVSLNVSEFWLDDRRFFTGMIRDISEEKEVDRLKSEFVSTVSHELRTPLTSIRGSLGLVSGGVMGDLPEEAKEYVDIALSNCERLVRLVNDILDIEKISSGTIEFKLRATSLHQLIEQSIVTNEAYAKTQGARLVLNNELSDVEVLVDPDRLLQVLTNLISNACKFSPDGGKVDITTKQIGDRLCVSIRDYGPGIPDEFKPKIFQRFAQADSSSTRSKGGTGLGLSISKAIIEQLKGGISFDDAPGGGTVFFFDLPYLPPVENRECKDTRQRLLVCEDDIDASRLLARTFESANYHVDVSPTVERALRLLSRYRYDAITIDLTLADGSGFDLLSEIRENESWAEIPAFIISGSSDASDVAALNVESIILKPFDQDEVLDTMNRVLRKCPSSVPNILHVEDDHDVAKIVQKGLPASWHIRHEDSIAGARVAIQNIKFDLILLDLVLPDGGGEDLLSDIGTTPVIIFSASEAPADLGKQVSAALVKTRSTPTELTNIISNLISKDAKKEAA